MNTEENLKIIDAVDRAIKQKDWKTFDELHAGTVLSFDPATKEPTKGIDIHRDAIMKMYSYFPDFNMKKVRGYGQGDWICLEYLLTGTHKGPLQTGDGKVIQPTNKTVNLPIGLSVKLKDGKIVEEHIYYDRLAMMTQLGVLPR